MLICTPTYAQALLVPADSLHTVRLTAATMVGAALYGSALWGLYHVWYADNLNPRFRLFNDWGEWNNIDKAGHAFSAYFETEVAYYGLRWTGVPPGRSIWWAAGISQLVQTTVEVFDGFSELWGFSLYDMAFNVAGTGLFVVQHQRWGEQRIRLKVSSDLRQYAAVPIPSTSGLHSTTLQARAESLFGRSMGERFLKDYNAQTLWLSANVQSLIPNLRVPGWLNLAAGYGTENVFGGFNNRWTMDGATYVWDQPRYRQWYLSPDIDLKRIKTSKPWLKTLLVAANVFKMPAPALEYKSTGRWRWHWLHW